MHIVQSMGWCSPFFGYPNIPIGYPTVLAPFEENTILSSPNCLLISGSVSPCVWGCFWILFCPLTYCSPACQQLYDESCSQLLLVLPLHFLFQRYFGYSKCFVLSMNFRISLLVFKLKKETMKILIKVESVDKVGWKWHHHTDWVLRFTNSTSVH